MAISSLPTMIMILDKVLSFEPTYKCAMHNMTTIKAFRLFFLSLTAFPFYLLPIFENKSGLLKLVRVT